MGNEKFNFDVFLSHNFKDKLVVRKLAERLYSDGLRVWFDEWVVRAGDDIYLTIEKGLEESRVLVLVMSPNTFRSDWVSLERSTSLFRDPANHQRHFVPLLLADCKIPDVLRRYKYIDFRKEEESAYVELLAACQGPRFVELCEALYEILGQSIDLAKNRPVHQSGDYDKDFWQPVSKYFVGILNAERGLVLDALTYIESQCPIECGPLTRELEFCDRFLRYTDMTAQAAKNRVVEEPPFLSTPNRLVLSELQTVYVEHKKIQQYLTESLNKQELSKELTSAIKNCIERLEEPLVSLAVSLNISDDLTVAPKPEKLVTPAVHRKWSSAQQREREIAQGTIQCEIGEYFEKVPVAYLKWDAFRPTSGFNFVSGTVHNGSKKKVSVQISAEILQYSLPVVSDSMALRPGQSSVFRLGLPTLKKDLAISAPVQAQIRIRPEEMPGGIPHPVTQRTVMLLPENHCLFIRERKEAPEDWTKYLCGWVTPEDKVLDDLLVNAPDRSPANYEEKARAIYDTLVKRNISYVEGIAGIGVDHSKEVAQRVQFPCETLKGRRANCTDASVLFASLMERVGCYPVLVVIARESGHHTIAGWTTDRNETDQDSLRKSCTFIEATGFTHEKEKARYSFDDAVAEGNEKVTTLEDWKGDPLENPVSVKPWGRILNVKYYHGEPERIYPIR